MAQFGGLDRPPGAFFGVPRGANVGTVVVCFAS
jgi:hypothetical protein